MAYTFPDFAVVVCADRTCSKIIVSILSKESAVALDILTYEEWLEDAHMLKYHLLFIRINGTWLYAKDASTKESIKKEIQSMLDQQRTIGRN